MASDNGPFTEKDLRDMNDHLQQAKDIEAQLDRAARAGVDVADLRKQLNDSKTQLLQIKRTYFPTR